MSDVSFETTSVDYGYIGHHYGCINNYSLYMVDYAASIHYSCILNLTK